MKTQKYFFPVLLIFASLVLLFMHLNNIGLYNTNLGFDGVDHKEYISWIQKNHTIPLPNQGWKFNQPPAYYLIASLVSSLGITPQIINLALVFFIAYLIYYFSKSKVVLLAILALPVLNYFPPLITNELLGSFFIVVCLLMLLNKPNPIVLGILLALGFYSKYTIITLIPIVLISYFVNESKHIHALKKSLISLVIFLLLISPILFRNISLYGKLMPLAPDFFAFDYPKQSTGLGFFLNLSWIPKLDTFSAKSYSFIGGLWDSFWLDGFHIITPVVAFHKKALVLWALGFPLTAISIFGIVKYYLKNRKKGIILVSYIVIAIFSLVKYYLTLPYDFVLKAFYAFGLIVPYTIGLGESSKNKYLKIITICLLIIQFIVMVSFFWIQPWWYVAK